LLLPNVLSLLIFLTLPSYKTIPSARCPAVFVVFVSMLVTGAGSSYPAVFLKQPHGLAYSGFRQTHLAGQILLGGGAEAYVGVRLTELLACGFVLFGWCNDQMGNAGENGFGGATVLVQIRVQHREIVFECQLVPLRTAVRSGVRAPLPSPL
jgi:hypothetical protein